MFDFGKFLAWIRGGLLEPTPTWEAYKADNHSWKTTAMQLSAPLVVGAGVLALVLGSLLGSGGGFKTFIVTLLMSAVWFGGGGFIASFLASKFGGEDSYDRAWSALSFASIPGVVGSVLGTVPWIGPILSLAGGIWTIIMLWQALPVFLNVPLDKRAGHFFSTLGLGIVLMFVTSSLLVAFGLWSFGSDIRSNDYSGSDSKSTEPQGRSERYTGNNTNNRNNSNPVINDDLSKGASFFGLGREVDYLQAAEKDRYEPPVDGMLSAEQVELTVKFLAATERLRTASSAAFEKLKKDKTEQPSLGDLMQGMKGLVNAGTAEMQAVKSGDGNWAEHTWVKKQLFDAQIHQDLNNTSAHNFELYQAHEEALKGRL